MSDDPTVIAGIGAAAVTAAVPLVLAGLGELVAERAGVINVGIEGLMLTGCIAGFAVTAGSGSPLLGLAAAIAAAMVLAALFAAATIWARADQIVTGLAINLLAAGLSGTIWQVLQNHGLGALPGGGGFVRGVGIPALATLPLIGPLLFDQYVLCHATIVLAACLWWALRRTRGGLIVRSLGEAPDACAAAGIRVRRWRCGCVLFAAACAGAAGAYLSIMRTHSFAPQMSGGKGFVVLALVIFGRWNVVGLTAGCLLFGIIDGVQQLLQSRGYVALVPFQAFKMLPYLVALAALTVLSRGAAGPVCLGKPWPESR